MRALIPICLTLLAACAAPAPRGDVPQAIPEVTVIPPDFGDADPHPFDGGREPGDYAVHGIDASRWQGVIDWPAARAGGVNFAFLKATEGGDIVDPMFATNFRAALAAGVPVGAYHFWYHCGTAAEQARWFIRHVPRVAGALPPVLDMEWTPFSPTCTKRDTPQVIRANALDFMQRLEKHYGQKPILYVAPDFFEENEMWKLGDYEFWLRSVAGHPKEVYGGHHWTFWQYTGTGIARGIDGKVDLNVFYGTERGWAAWLAARQM